jgi:hypothetical protein
LRASSEALAKNDDIHCKVGDLREAERPRHEKFAKITLARLTWPAAIGLLTVIISTSDAGDGRILQDSGWPEAAKYFNMDKSHCVTDFILTQRR